MNIAITVIGLVVLLQVVLMAGAVGYFVCKRQYAQQFESAAHLALNYANVLVHLYAINKGDKHRGTAAGLIDKLFTRTEDLQQQVNQNSKNCADLFNSIQKMFNDLRSSLKK